VQRVTIVGDLPVSPDGQTSQALKSQVELTIEPGEYINVPTGTEHWFVLTERRRIKAVRYFAGTDGWVPEYTGRELGFQPAVNSL
jgi:cupin superfamily acireductone dioxygenase involved in methionine salvage